MQRAGDHQRRRGQTPKGIKTENDSIVSNIPASMIADPFGISGLLTCIRKMDDPEIAGLAIGQDLTKLGMDLSLQERILFRGFGGPFSDQSLRAREKDADVGFHFILFRTELVF